MTDRYTAHLQSEYWRALCADAMSRCGAICEVCHQRPARQGHHLHYRTLGRESLDDIRMVCGPCHLIQHGKRRRKDGRVVAIRKKPPQKPQGATKRKRLDLRGLPLATPRPEPAQVPITGFRARILKGLQSHTKTRDWSA